jgi:hypothetical protein
MNKHKNNPTKATTKEGEEKEEEESFSLLR